MATDRLNSAKKHRTKAKTASIGAARSIALLYGILFLAMSAKAIPFFVPPTISINGPGYLLVRDPVCGLAGVIRFGEVSVDAEGFLITSYGKRVEGYNDSALSVIGDLRINGGGGHDSMAITSYDIESNGCIVVSFPDGSSMLRGQILLQRFQNPCALTAQGWQSFGWSSSAGPLPQPVPPGKAGTGWLAFGVLEQMAPKVQLSQWGGTPQTFNQGVLAPTAVPTDIGIENDGFFVLRNTNDNTLFATRAGAFYLDGSGYLVHYSGLRLQGYTDSTLASLGDLQIDPQGSPTSNPGLYAVDFGIDQYGVITEAQTDGTIFVRGQILLAGCVNPNLLARTNFDLYPLASNAALWTPLAPPLSASRGWLVPGSLELNQFDTNLLAVRSHLNFFNQGFIGATNLPSDLAISGFGFFTVRDPVANTLYATRCGAFQLDGLGHLVTTNGFRLQGFTSGLGTQTGDLTIITAGMLNYSISWDGTIQVSMSDGSTVVCGQVLLQAYRNLQGLVPVGNGLYSNLVAALPLYTNGQPALMSFIQSSAVEQVPPPPPALQLPPARGFRLFISDLTEGIVESSSDLLHWNVLGPVLGSPDLNVAEFFDTPQTPQTFYRVIVPRP